MYNKEDLSSKGISELLDIAKEFGAEVEINDKMGKEDIIYAILDKQAEGDTLLGTKRRRTRIVKKDTDRVYTVNGKDGENFDIKKNKAAESDEPAPDSADNANAETPQEEMTPEMILASMPKHRGRKSKRELELMAAAEEARRAAEEQAANANNTDMQPE